MSFHQLDSGLFIPSGAYEAVSARERFEDDFDNYGPQSASESGINTLHSYSKHYERNNPWAQNGINSWCAAAVGDGITPRWQLDDEGMSSELQELWDDFAEECDFNDKLNVCGLQSLGLKTTISSGTAYIVKRLRPLSEGHAVPLQIQILEPEQRNHETEDGFLSNGDYIRSGVRYSEEGKRKAYCFHKYHPHDHIDADNEHCWINASDVSAMHRVDRPGQESGTPWLSSALLRLRELDQYEDAELVRKKTAALFVMAVEEESPVSEGRQPRGSGKQKETKDKLKKVLSPGTVQKLPAGMSATFSNPADVGATYEPWLRFQLLSIAKGMGITYEMLTGDLKNVNYSSIRAGLIEFRRLCEQVQHNIVIRQFCRPVMAWFLDTVAMYKIIDLPEYTSNRRRYLNQIHWQLPRWDEVDPLKKVTSDVMEVRAGFSTIPDKLSERGIDLNTFIRTTRMVNQLLDENNILLDSDPRKVDGKGAYQSTLEDIDENEKNNFG